MSEASRLRTSIHPGAAPDWPDARYAWYVVGTLNLAYLIAWIDRMVISLLVEPIQRDLGLSDTDMGMVTGLAFGLCYTLFGLPAGYAADRWSRRNLIIAGMLIWSAATFACGLAGGFVALFLARVWVGIGEAVLHPASTSLIADHFPPERRAPAFGAYTMAAAAATTVALLAGGPLVQWLGMLGRPEVPLLGAVAPWQAAFMIASLPGLLLALLMLLTVREPRRRDLASSGQRTGATLSEAMAFFRRERATMGALAIGQPLVMLGAYSLLAWLPVLFSRTWGWSTATTAVSYALSAGLASAIVSTWLSGWLVRRFRARGRTDAVLLACIVGAVGLNALAAVAYLAPTPVWALVFFTLSGSFQLVPVATAMLAITEFAPNQLRAKATAVLIFSIGIITNSLGPFAVGVLNDQVFADPASIRYSLFTLTVISGGLGIALLLLGRRAYRRSLERMAGGFGETSRQMGAMSDASATRESAAPERAEAGKPVQAPVQ